MKEDNKEQQMQIGIVPLELKDVAKKIAEIADALFADAKERNVQVSMDTAYTSATIIYSNLHSKLKG